MPSVTIEEAQAHLVDLVHRLLPGEELVLTENGRAVARLVPQVEPAPGRPREPGFMRGTVLYMAPDFDAPLDYEAGLGQ